MGSYLQPAYSHCFNLLTTRQARLSGDSLLAAQLIESSLLSSIDEEFHQIYRLEQCVLRGDKPNLTRSEMIEAFLIDKVLLGSVYLEYMLANIDSTETSNRFLRAELARLAGDYEGALREISDDRQSEIALADKIWMADLLMHSDNYSDAMSIVDSAIFEDSSLVSAWQLKAVLLMKSHLYYEAFESMTTALPLTSNAPECMALAGLSAEFAGESKLAVENYAPLLAISKDSVVLINRLRVLVNGDILNYNYDCVETDLFCNTDRSWLSGRANFNFSGTTGEFEQNTLGASIDVYHYYGLYGSMIKASASYSHQDWPRYGSAQKITQASLTALHSTTGSFYGTAQSFFYQKRHDRNRWRAGITSGIGRYFHPVQPLLFDLEAKFGREMNKWDIESGYEANWTATAALRFKIEGKFLSNYLPRLAIDCTATQDLNNLSRYDIHSTVQLEYSASRFVSFSVGYSTEYLSSVPPDYINIVNANTFARIGLNF